MWGDQRFFLSLECSEHLQSTLWSTPLGSNQRRQDQANFANVNVHIWYAQKMAFDFDDMEARCKENFVACRWENICIPSNLSRQMHHVPARFTVVARTKYQMYISTEKFTKFCSMTGLVYHLPLLLPPRPPQAEAMARLEQGDEDARFLLGVEVPDSWKGGLLGREQACNKRNCWAAVGRYFCQLGIKPRLWMKLCACKIQGLCRRCEIL